MRTLKNKINIKKLVQKNVCTTILFLLLFLFCVFNNFFSLYLNNRENKIEKKKQSVVTTKKLS